MYTLLLRFQSVVAGALGPRFAPFVVASTLVAGAAPPPAAAQEIDIRVRSVRMRIVEFDEPKRVGYGPGAIEFREALEVSLDVAPYEERTIEPFLYIGTMEIRGHDVARQERTHTLTFLVPEFRRLKDGESIILTTQHGAPIRDERLRRSAKFRYRLKDVKWTGGVTPPGGAYGDARVVLADPRGRAIDAPQMGDPVAIGFRDLPRGAPVQLYVLDDEGREWSYARLFAGDDGAIAPTVVWHHTGVIGEPRRGISWRPEPAFGSFEEAGRYFANHEMRIELRTLAGELIRTVPLRIQTTRSTPLLYPSDSEGRLVNAFEIGQDVPHASGRGFPPGSTIGLYVVKNQYGWATGDEVADRRNLGEAQIITLSRLETSFTVPLWDAREARVGAFDIVARVLDRPDPAVRFRLAEDDIVSYGEDTGFLNYVIINGNIVIDSAGYMRSAPAKFEFSDSFQRGQPVHAAVDPTDVPAVHSGGNYAEYFVVEHQPQAYWDGPSPTLTDVSGGTEIKRVKYWCINITRANIWNSPNPPGAVGEYDVIVDFGATPAMNAADFVSDGVYNKGVDFIDGYDRVGFYVVDDPSTPGAFPVGAVTYYDDTFNTPSDPNDPFDLTSTGFPLVRNWFSIRYPGAVSGSGVSLPAGGERYPVVLFLHGRHRICSGVPSSQAMDVNCAGTRIPNHGGYDYILDVLASRGFIAMSIDAYDIQPSNATGNYEARGRLVLEHLNRLREWDAVGTDPFGGIFQNRIDLSRIGLVGHSRGGEGVVAASQINVAESATYGHDIAAVAAIAPTDQQAVTSWNIESAPYLLLASAADGDVSNQQGFRTYDRAFPTGAPSQHEKSVAWVYGANHNFYNTIWTPDALLPSPHGYDWASDDGAVWTGPRLTADEQRQIGLVTLVAFFRYHLQGIDAYREIFTGRLPISTVRNDMMHWSYQDPVRLVLDDFEQSPHSVTSNTLGGAAAASGSVSTATEAFLNTTSGSSGYFHQTWAAQFGWSSAGTYTSDLPAASRDVSAFTHLSFRVALPVDAFNPVGAPANLRINLRDTDGDQAMWDLETDDFTPIPYPYPRSATSAQYQMKTVRIPLRNFTMNNSGVDLDRIDRLRIELPATGFVAIDDIQFSN